jgi:HSP20 family protein
VRLDTCGTRVREDTALTGDLRVLAISGERKREAEEKGEDFYRSEREYGSLYRGAVPLPDGVALEDVNATFSDGVLR